MAGFLVRPIAKQNATGADHRRACIDRQLVVIGHAHGKLIHLDMLPGLGLKLGLELFGGLEQGRGGGGV